VAEPIGADVTLVPLPLPADTAYLWDLYVLPTERSNGRAIAPSNQASRRTRQKSGPGARIVGGLRYLELITRMYIRYTPWAGPLEQTF
jgi:hypothetical protein